MSNRALEPGRAIMDKRRARPYIAAAAALLVAHTIGLAESPLFAAEKKKPAKQAAASEPTPPKPEGPAKAERREGKGEAIVVLVNDEPITEYEIGQRAGFLAAHSGGGGGDMKAKAEARWAQIVKDPKTNEKFRDFLKAKNVRTEAEAKALQKEYVANLQKNMVEQIKREDRARSLPKHRKDAQDELIEERLKLQEAKRVGIQVSEDEVNHVMKGLAERNKLTVEQFQQSIKGSGFDVSTMRDRFRAQFAWREVVRRKFSALVSITQRDVDRMITASARETGEDTVELQVQKITLLTEGKADQAAMARRVAQADALRSKFGGCNTLASLARDAGNARHDDLKFIKPSSVPEPTRTFLASASDGDLLPPVTAGNGVEVYAVCGRRTVKADEKQREKAEGELAQREFEITAKRYLRDLMQDAHIEYR